MLTIPLLPYDSGVVTKVDNADFWALATVDWYCLNGYAAFNRRVGDSYQLVYMHRVVAGATKNEFVDHVNRDPLDNRSRNLRICTQSENRRNSRKPRHFGGRPTTSRYKGVTFIGGHRPWLAKIHTVGGDHHLGKFVEEDSAARAYDNAARTAFGSFARLNFPGDVERAALDAA